MVSDDLLSDVLSEFARTLTTDFPIQGILDHLVGRIVDLLPIDGAGVTLISPSDSPHYIAASDDAALRFEHLQSALEHAPCLAAYETNTCVALADVSQDDRFPVFAGRAVEAGLAAVFAFPLRHGDQRLGALDLYRDSVGPLTDLEMTTAQTLADVATAYLINARARADLSSSAAQENARLRRRDQVKDEYLATVIHELKTPMTSIAGYTEILEDSDLDEVQRSLLRAIVRSSDRLSAQAADLMTLLSLEQSTIARQHVALDLREVLLDAQATLEPLVEARPLEVTFTVPDEPVMLLGDVRDLERMVSNLVSNALKFTNPPGWVRVELQPGPTWVRIVVADNGIGVPQEEQQHLFTRFYRSVRAESKAVPGTGLGLSIVESIVTRHAGTISVDSREGLGSTFVVELPLLSLADLPG